MLNIYARTFLEATRVTPNTRPDPQTQRHLDEHVKKRSWHARLWHRGPYWT